MFVARPSVWRMLLLIAGAAAFVALSLWIAGYVGQQPAPGKGWIGWLGIIVFGLCGIIGVVRLFDTAEQVRISRQGVYSRQWSETTIPWSEIVDITEWQAHRQRTIILHLRDPKKYPSTRLAGKLAGANRALTGGDIAITMTGTDRSFADADAAVRKYRP